MAAFVGRRGNARGVAGADGGVGCVVGEVHGGWCRGWIQLDESREVMAVEEAAVGEGSLVGSGREVMGERGT
jgi:hypothetical protein